MKNIKLRNEFDKIFLPLEAEECTDSAIAGTAKDALCWWCMERRLG